MTESNLILALDKSLTKNVARDFSTFREGQENFFTSWKYADLASAVQRISQLLEKYSAAGDRVCVLANRTGLAYATILSCIFKQRVYVPLGVRLPTSRMREILSLTGCSLLIADNAFFPKALDLQKNADVDILNLEGKEDYGLSRKKPAIARKSNEFSRENIPAYIIYTSGSTGVPKGVVVSHDNLFSYLTSLGEVLDVGPEDRMSQCFELNFDSGLGEFFYGVLQGASIHPLQSVEIPLIQNFFNRVRPTVWGSTPSLLQMIRRNSLLRPPIKELRLSLLMGERLTAELTKFWKELCPNSRVFNLYGPTETTINVLYHEWNRTDPDFKYGVPIGRPLSSTSIELIDGEGKHVQKGEAGEILVGGEQVSLGYLNDPQKSSISFFKKNSSDNRSLWYRTGDFAFEEEGVLHFIGRKDSQVKIRGFRLELNEVEFWVRQKFPDINAVALVQKEKDLPGLVLALDRNLSVDQTEELVTHLKTSLPSYAIPDQIYFVSDWPVTNTGKTDRPRFSDEFLKNSAHPLLTKGVR